QFAKEATESEVLVLCQMLVTEEDHEVLGQRAVDFIERAIAERLRQIDAADFASDNRCQLIDRDRVIWCRLLCHVLVTRPVIRTNGIHRALLLFRGDPTPRRAGGKPAKLMTGRLESQLCG